MSFISDFTKLPEDVVIDLINFDNGTAFTADTLRVVGDPLAIPKAPPAFRNTEIVVRPTNATKKYGTTRLWYNRIALDTVPGLRSNVFAAPAWANMISDIIPLVNARYRINLTAKDYIDAALPPITSVGQPITIQAAPNSLVYIGSLELIVNIDGDTGIPLESIITQQYLDIFRWGRIEDIDQPIDKIVSNQFLDIFHLGVAEEV